jgi:hypothetical protein
MEIKKFSLENKVLYQTPNIAEKDIKKWMEAFEGMFN